MRGHPDLFSADAELHPVDPYECTIVQRDGHRGLLYTTSLDLLYAFPVPLLGILFIQCRDGRDPQACTFFLSKEPKTQDFLIVTGSSVEDVLTQTFAHHSLEEDHSSTDDDLSCTMATFCGVDYFRLQGDQEVVYIFSSYEDCHNNLSDDDPKNRYKPFEYAPKRDLIVAQIQRGSPMQKRWLAHIVSVNTGDMYGQQTVLEANTIDALFFRLFWKMRRSTLLKWGRTQAASTIHHFFATRIGSNLPSILMSVFFLSIHCVIIWSLKPSGSLTLHPWGVSTLVIGMSASLINIALMDILPPTKTRYLLLGGLLFLAEETTILFASYETPFDVNAWGSRAYFLVLPYIPLWTHGESWRNREAQPWREQLQQKFSQALAPVFSILHCFRVYPAGIIMDSLPKEGEHLSLVQDYLYSYHDNWKMGDQWMNPHFEKCRVRVYRKRDNRLLRPASSAVIICSAITQETLANSIELIATDIWRREEYPWPVTWIVQHRHPKAFPKSFYLHFRCNPLTRTLHTEWMIGCSIRHEVETFLRKSEQWITFDTHHWVEYRGEDSPDLSSLS